MSEHGIRDPRAVDLHDGARLTVVREAAAANAQPPQFLVPFEKPSGGDGIAAIILFIAGGMAAVVYWVSVLVLWVCLHALLWVVGHPVRLGIGAAFAGGAYAYMTHRAGLG